MEISKLIQKIENGKQVGVSEIVRRDNRDFLREYAVQKIKGKYVAYAQEFYLDEMYFHEGEFNEFNEHFEVYESLEEIFELFKNKYNVLPEDMNTSRGNKFFQDKWIKLVRYIGETSSLTLTHNKIYYVWHTENDWFRIIDDSGEDYLYPPELFEEI